MDTDRTWMFCGRYGSDYRSVKIRTLPEELPDDLKELLVKAYNASLRELEQIGRRDEGYKLQELGLVEPIGNAWNRALLWAPQVHAFMKNENPNAAMEQQLKKEFD